MILANMAVRRLEGADAVDISDLTDSVRTGTARWSEEVLDTLIIPMDPEPTPAEQLAIRRRLVTVDAADEAHLYSLLALTPASPFEQAWLAEQLRDYREAT